MGNVVIVDGSEDSCGILWRISERYPGKRAGRSRDA